MESADLVMGVDGLARCWWPGTDPTYLAYHDEEWGRPLRDERALYGLLVLEGFQAGLAWITILRKRPAFEAAFEGFDPEVVARYGEAEQARLLADAGIVRHRAKCEMAVANARAVLGLWAAGDTLADLCARHAPPARPARLSSRSEIRATTAESTALAKALKARGFTFMGPTVVYALLQSAGFVDDHLDGCFVPDPPAAR